MNEKEVIKSDAVLHVAWFVTVKKSYKWMSCYIMVSWSDISWYNTKPLFKPIFHIIILCTNLQIPGLYFAARVKFWTLKLFFIIATNFKALESILFFTAFSILVSWDGIPSGIPDISQYIPNCQQCLDLLLNKFCSSFCIKYFFPRESNYRNNKTLQPC